MGQITIYLDDEHERRLRLAAAQAGQPISRWVARLIEERTEQQWPKAVQELAGIWTDLPSAEELRTTPPSSGPAWRHKDDRSGQWIP